MEEDSLVPISALQHYSFCPRQCGLIHLEQCFEDNMLTMRGHVVHKRVEEAEPEIIDDRRVERSLPLYSNAWGLIGKSDVVEFSADGTPYPIEYKSGVRAAHIHDDIQLAAQCLCLEEMLGVPVPKGAIYHFSSRRRREVIIDLTLREITIRTIGEVRQMMHSMTLPAPVADKRCKNCSLIELCQPSLINEQNENISTFRKLLKSTDL